MNPPIKRKFGLLRTIAVLLVLAALSLNLYAFVYAYGMTHVQGGERTTLQQLGNWAGLYSARARNKNTPATFNLKFQDVTLTSADGTRLAAWDVTATPSKGTVVLVHGFLGNRSHLVEEAREIHDMGWSVLLVDLRGTDKSEGCSVTLGVKEAEDIVAAAKWPESGPVVLYGESMGASAVIRAVGALNAPADGLILEAPFARLSEAVRAHFRRKKMPDFFLTELVLFWGGVQHGYDAFAHNPEVDAAKIKVPTLVFVGDQDDKVPPHDVRRVAKALKNVTFVEIPGQGHCATLAFTPTQWKENVASLLERVARSSVTQPRSAR